MISWSLNLRQRGSFSQFLIKKRERTKKLKGEVFGYVIDLNWHFISFIYLFVFVSIETVFDHISRHLKARQKYSATRCIFNSFLSVWKCDQPQSFVFDTLLLNLILCNDIIKASKPFPLINRQTNIVSTLR